MFGSKKMSVYISIMKITSLIILLVILIIMGVYFKWNDKLALLDLHRNNNIENFSCSDDVADEEGYQSALTQSQQNQLKQLVNDQTMKLMNSSSSLMQGPTGGRGPQGPPGGEFQAMGRLVNQSASYRNKESNAFTPELVTTRTSGTIPTQSLCLMDTPSLGSFQYWFLNKNGTIQNRYDNTCINYDPTKSSGTKVFMGSCEPSNFNQWIWDKDNRLVFKHGSSNQCLTVTQPQSGISTTTIPGCNGDKECLRRGNRVYLSVKDYKTNKLYDDEMWSFI